VARPGRDKSRLRVRFLGDERSQGQCHGGAAVPGVLTLEVFFYHC
jgi:hypothetical protein